MNPREVASGRIAVPPAAPVGPGRWRRIFGRPEFFLPVLIVLFTLPVSLKALQSYFTFDDLMNLNYYLRRPWTAIGSNLLVFTSFRRPLGALAYLPLFGIAGLNPEPYYLAGVILYSVNIILAFRLFLRLARNRFTAFVAASLLALHPEVHNVLFNFGAVFELLCLLCLLVSAIAYLGFLEGTEPRPRARYVLSLLGFLAALNAKETAAAYPVILVSLHLFYTRDFRSGWAGVKRVALQVAPFFLVVVPYTLVKMFGAEAYWRENPQYAYHFDASILTNLAHYLELLSNREVVFSAAGAVGLLVALAGLGWLLRNGTVLFGLSWAILSLLPVLPLPRYWGLFLYVPLAGFSLAAAALIADLGRRLSALCLPEKVNNWKPGKLVVLVLASMYMFRLLGAMSPDIDRARRAFYHERNPSWRSFAEQLYATYSALPDGTLLVFTNPPFDDESHERWCLYFLVSLKYGPDIRIARKPEDDSRLPALIRAATAVHFLVWDGRALQERPASGR